MSEPREPNPEADLLRERISSLSAAILRINASLDLVTVLREAIESARALTGARYGIVATVDEAGRAQEFVPSGLPPDEQHRLTSWPEARVLFEHLRELDGPLRLPDLPAFVRSLGIAPDPIPCKTYQGTPMRHRGVYVGGFFLGDKEDGGEFTDEDEEVLVLFASQTAAAIANARTHRDEQRARADLEALIDTSQVGVVVFDAKTAVPLSVNREARRIVASLHRPGGSALELVDMMTARRADGREVSLDELKTAETLRGEEIELSVPDGRSIRMLINVTPIGPEDGEIESVVVTMQDLAPLEALERSRSEFLSLVSHELRAPLTSIKGSASSALRITARSPDPAELRQFFRIIEAQADRMDDLIGDLLDTGRIDTGTLSVDPVPAQVAALVDQARNTFLSGGARHTVVIDLPPELPAVLADERRIVQVLNNLFTNAARHSPEAAPIRVAAERDGVHVAISVTDAGEGLSAERLAQLFRKHAGVRGREGEPRGTGLGLVICKGLVEAHGGRVRAESGGDGRGTRFTFTLPAVEGPGGALAGAAASPRRGRREKASVLVVDDDPETLRYVRDALAAAGYAPLVTGDPKEVSAIVRTKRPQLVLLDLMLPGTDGIALMDGLPELADLPVIFISGYGGDETVAKVLEAGAADYIVKPFSPTELTARVGAALRRRAEPEPFVLGELAIDYERRAVTVAGRAVRLTPKEYEMLRVLSTNAGRVMSYVSLLDRVWENAGNDNGDSEPVRGVVKKLRRKLGDDPAKPAWIVNERGVGYRMRTPDED